MKANSGEGGAPPLIELSSYFYGEDETARKFNFQMKQNGFFCLHFFYFLSARRIVVALTSIIIAL